MRHIEQARSSESSPPQTRRARGATRDRSAGAALGAAGKRGGGDGAGSRFVSGPGRRHLRRAIDIDDLLRRATACIAPTLTIAAEHERGAIDAGFASRIAIS